MSMEFHKHARFVASAAVSSPGAADWHGLRARMAAAYAARAALAPARARPREGIGGSFNGHAARLLAAFGRSQGGELDGVNRTALASSKSTYDNDAAVAGAYVAGD